MVTIHLILIGSMSRRSRCRTAVSYRLCPSYRLVTPSHQQHSQFYTLSSTFRLVHKNWEARIHSLSSSIALLLKLSEWHCFHPVRPKSFVKCNQLSIQSPLLFPCRQIGCFPKCCWAEVLHFHRQLTNCTDILWIIRFCRDQLKSWRSRLYHQYRWSLLLKLWWQRIS